MLFDRVRCNLNFLAWTNLTENCEVHSMLFMWNFKTTHGNVPHLPSKLAVLDYHRQPHSLLGPNAALLSAHLQPTEPPYGQTLKIVFQLFSVALFITYFHIERILHHLSGSPTYLKLSNATDSSRGPMQPFLQPPTTLILAPTFPALPP